MNKYLEGNAKNITCSLYKLASFIRQRKLEDNTTEAIPQISKFGFVIWTFLSTIYKASWNKLIADINNRFFR